MKYLIIISLFCIFLFMGCEKEPVTETSTTNSDSISVVTPQRIGTCAPPFRTLYSRELFEKRWGGLWEVAELYNKDGVLVFDHPGDKFYFPTPFQYEYGGYPRTLGVYMGADSTIDVFEWVMYKNVFNIKKNYGPGDYAAEHYNLIRYISVDMDLCRRSKDTIIFYKWRNKQRRLILVRPK